MPCLLSVIDGPVDNAFFFLEKGIEKAVHEIQIISDERSKQAYERLEIPKVFHPFITGAYNEKLKSLNYGTGVKINIPPPSVQKDEISIAGEKDGVLKAKQAMLNVSRVLYFFFY